MAQYFRVLTTYRLESKNRKWKVNLLFHFRQPGREQDRQLSSGEESKEEEHIIVGRRGVWWSLRSVKCRREMVHLYFWLRQDLKERNLCLSVQY